MAKISINFIPLDISACGYYRIINVAEALQAIKEPNSALGKYNVSISSPGKFDYTHQDYIFTQRIAGSNNLNTLINLKKQTGVKFIVDYDDDVWTELPRYNKCTINWADNNKSMKEHLNELVDIITVSTDALKKSLTQFVPAHKIKVIPNMIPRFKWNYNRVDKPTNDEILYAGSPTHFDNTTNHYGDFTNEWDKFLTTRKVNIMGICPWFVNENKHYNWTNMLDYPHSFYDIARSNKYIIAPLCENEFNRCKSDLKYLECCAVGRVCICTDFEGSPYHYAHELQKVPTKVTAKQLEYIFKQCDEHYDEIIEYQYDYLNNRILENNVHLYEELFRTDKLKV